MAELRGGDASVFDADNRSGVNALAKIAGSLLHRYRHRRARRQLRRARPRSILVVCHGNICRSPYLEAVLRSLLPEVRVSSAGLIGPGRSVPAHGISVAHRRGLDLTVHRSRLLTREVLASVDLVIVMDEAQARYLVQAVGILEDRVIIAGDLDPMAGTRGIRDPWLEPLDVFETSYARLDRCGAALAESLQFDL